MSSRAKAKKTERSYIYLDEDGEEQRASKADIGSGWFLDEAAAQQELRNTLIDQIAEQQEEMDRFKAQVAEIGGVDPGNVGDASVDDMAPLAHVAVVRVLAEQWGGPDAVRLAWECERELAEADAA